MLPIAAALARVGCCTIGTIYALIGVWAMLALFRLAAPAADEQRILHRMSGWPFGSVLLAALALGTVAYILWLMFDAVFDPFEFGDGLKGVAERIGIALTSLAYGRLGWSAVMVLVGGGGNGEQQRRSVVWYVLEWPGGRWLVGAVGVGVAIVALFQIKYVYQGQHRRWIQLRRSSRYTRVIVDVLGWAGYGARCAILAVLGWFLVHAAWAADANDVGDTDSAFNFLGLSGSAAGHVLFSAVAVGTICYGVFMYVNALRFKAQGR
jgi:hypothetical protein